MLLAAEQLFGDERVATSVDCWHEQLEEGCAMLVLELRHAIAPVTEDEFSLRIEVVGVDGLLIWEYN